jgi:hypothetical protein
MSWLEFVRAAAISLNFGYSGKVPTPPLRLHSSPVRRLSELSLGQHRMSIRFSVAQKVIEGFFPGPLQPRKSRTFVIF